MLKEIIILLLVIFLLSRVVRFFIPIFRIGSAASAHMRKMQQQMNEMQNQGNQANKVNNPAPQRKNNKKEGDYIDYEEVR